MNQNCLILASGSPRRQELLGALVKEFKIVVSGVPEPVALDRSPEENILSIARAKAEAVSKLSGDCVVLAADTDVVLDGEILGKPADSADAVAMLKRLRGREHEVLSAVVVFDPVRGTGWHEVVRSIVRIRNLSDPDIDAYVATAEPLDKAGAYAIQGVAASMVESVTGCYTNVVGLPLCATRRLLTFAGAAINPNGRCTQPNGSICPGESPAPG